jgi:chromosome segregation protein
MQLTKLEIRGFKSFGDKVVINFDEGITGIVGPNGCGKSNVVDSIRWVLGEQRSRMLRSDKMENVIFNGTKKRKPTNLAEVSLTFNNTKNLLPTEYSQVTITRRYYRSGESEYELNGVTCRLKDISNLFLDTGIASNSYAIIELKMVDDILNDKDNSRRGLFEEAAGISKFKVRKKETLRKLSDTDADLARVEDLLFEIEKNLKSLEKQARQAQQYYKIKEEYKEASIALARKTVEKHQQSFRDGKSKIETENDLKLSLNRQLAEKEAAIEKSKADLIAKEKQLSSRQKALNEHVGKIRSYESEKKIKNERLRFLNDKNENLREQIEQDRKSNERASFSIESLTKEKQVADKILSEVAAKLDRLKGEYDHQKTETAALQEEVNILNRNFRQKREEVYQLTKDLEIKQIQLSTLKQELDKAASDTTEQSANLEEFEIKLQEVGQLRAERQKEIDKLKSEEEAVQSRIESIGKTLEVIKEEGTQVSRKLDARQNEYALTKSLVENLEGFPEAIKFLKKNSSWGKDAPLLSDVITCPEEYRVTIENFLEPYMNYYIVESEANAYQAINLLSDAAKGKAHFFILEKFDKFKPTSTKIIQNAIPATEVVEFDGKYKKLVSFILDNVYISTNHHTDLPDVDDAIFITKNGKVTRRHYSISGGAVGLFEGKRIGRAKNLEKLAVEIKALNKKLDEIQQSIESNQADLNALKASSKKDKIEALLPDLNQINEEYVSIRTKQEQFSKMLTSNTTKREDIIDRIEVLTEELRTLQPKAEREQDLQKSDEEDLASKNSELQVFQEILSQKSAAFNQENISYHQQENKVASIAQEISFKENTYESSKERIERNQSELKQTEEEIKALVEKAEMNDDELVAMYSEREAIEGGVNEAEKEYYSSRGLIDELEKESREIQRRRESTDLMLMEFQNQLNETKLQLSAVKERLSVEFNIDLDDLLKEKGPEEGEEVKENPFADISDEELREKVSRFKTRIDNIGPINPMAMEAFEEIKERYDFIIKEKDDLIKAKESLISTIGEIDAVARETFIDAFEKIRANFIKVFRSLFTEEDDCELKLLNPDDPLESPIEIMAKPKGKRPLTINQLSGGEKTLTAISLLFSIYLLKPAPFCIFDEVDAPLDDANIDKFNNIIRTFSKESQFIIVTHNKRTMSSTDIIYGITMIEQGVSRVVPVDLRELA